MAENEPVIELSHRDRRLFGTRCHQLPALELDTGPAFERLVRQQCSMQQREAGIVSGVDYWFGLEVYWLSRSQERFIQVATVVLAHELQRELGIPVQPADEVSYE